MPISISQYTEKTVTGTGVFDVMMQAVSAHLSAEYKAGRIKGADYANVYLGSLTSVMDKALAFLLAQERTNKELELLDLQKLKVTAETNLIDQQAANALTQNAQIIAQTSQIDAQTNLIDQQTANAVTENTVLVASECKLRAEYDVLMEQKLKTIAETGLLNQKKVTEIAQTSGTGVDAESVIGKQIALYQAQRDGYIRDAEQKATKLMADTWSVRRTTDEGTLADEINFLSDANVGRAVTKLLAGIGA